MEKPFIGMGRSPDGTDIPIGFSMELAMRPEALSTFGKMSPEEKHAAIRYIQGGSTGDEAKLRIRNVVSCLEAGKTRGF